MKIPSRIEWSLCGTIPPLRPVPWLAVAAIGKANGNELQSWQLPRRGKKATLPKYGCGRVIAFFSSNATPTLSRSPRRPSSIGDNAPAASRRAQSGAARAQTAEPTQYYHKEELMGLVDESQDGDVEEHLKLIRDPYLNGYAPADGPQLTVSDRPEDTKFPQFSELHQTTETDRETIQKLWRAISLRLRNPYHSSIETIYRLYVRLPEPRMSYLHAKIRHDLLQVLGREKKNSKSMLRYFAVVADVQNDGFQLTRAEWNSAISFASRYVGHSTDVELTAALNLWKEMEQSAGIKANSITFNILFDVASKAGNFDLATMIFEEMGKRGFAFNRYHHVSLIHFFGLKMDSDGIRAAYKEMVEAGEMVDTVVLNCVMAGFLRCGEEADAERLYERMKAAHDKAPSMPYHNYMNDRVITKVLMMFAKIGRHNPVLRSTFQAASPIVPNIQTYRILLNHYAVRIGFMDKVAQFLDDMKWFQIPLHGAIFLALFKGFAIHGGPAGPSWSEQRLKEVWNALLEALDRGTVGLYIDTWLVIWALRAFRKCSPEENELYVVYQSLAERWELSKEEVDHLEDIIANLVRKDGRTFQDMGAFYRRNRF